jgi:hypothetical protein
MKIKFTNVKQSAQGLGHRGLYTSGCYCYYYPGWRPGWLCGATFPSGSRTLPPSRSPRPRSPAVGQAVRTRRASRGRTRRGSPGAARAPGLRSEGTAAVTLHHRGRTAPAPDSTPRAPDPQPGERVGFLTLCSRLLLCAAILEDPRGAPASGGAVKRVARAAEGAVEDRDAGEHAHSAPLGRRKGGAPAERVRRRAPPLFLAGADWKNAKCLHHPCLLL